MPTAPTQRDPRTDPLLASVPEESGYKVLDRRYVLYDTLGHGGMGVVFKGRHAELEVDLAVKCLDPSLARRDQGLVTRFKKEARAAAHLRHENIVQVMDVSECAGVHYLVMEFIAGEDARRRVARKRELEIGEAARIALGAAKGLAAAHAAGLVHRDVKPDNVMIGSDGSVKVADLGLAKSEGSDTGLTMSGATMGTPLYMPPEQFGDTKNVGPPADVYALGATLYFLLVGKDGVKPGSIAQVLDQVRSKPFPDPREARPEVPDVLAELVLACTRKEPSERPQRAEDVAATIADYLEGPGPELADPQAGTVMVDTLVSPPPPNTLATIRMTFAGTKTLPPQGADERAPDAAPRPARPVGLLVGAGAALVALVLLLVLRPWASGDEPAATGELASAAPAERAEGPGSPGERSPVDPAGSALRGAEGTLPNPQERTAQQVPLEGDDPAPARTEPATPKQELRELDRAEVEEAPRTAAPRSTTTETPSVPAGGGAATPRGSASARTLAPSGMSVVQSVPGPGESTQPPGPGADAGWAWRVRHDDTGVEFLLVEPGTFEMGSPTTEKGRDPDETARSATVGKPFYLATTELTQAQWKAVMDTNPSHHEGDTLPVERVSWLDANAYVSRLGWRLPTSTEWEYACRAGTQTPFSSGSSTDDLARIAWFDEDPATGATHPVGEKPANGWGFHDMHGNVREWCQDVHRASSAHDARQHRGGSYKSLERHCRAANRGGARPRDDSRDLGLRPALTVGG